MLESNDSTSQPHNINQVQRNTPGEKQGNLSWIIDTGATDHVTHEKNHFITFYKIKLISVRLPNNSLVTAAHAGTIQFSKEFVIFNVLYIPDFAFNLIFVQRLTKDLNCILTFSPEFCQIQDSSTLRMIGHANVYKGLYYLQCSPIFNQDFVPSIVLSYKHVDVDLWHYRLGHPGQKTIEQLCRNFPYIQIHSKTVCDICHYAKQHKLSYNHSASHSDNCFDLIHCDIWGPVSIPSVHGHKYFLTIVDDHSRHTWAFLMNAKSQTRELLQNFVVKIKA